MVAALAYPHTRAGVRIDRRDIPNQSADASFVLDRIVELDRAPHDAFAGHLAVDRLAAVGFSAGGTTTLGLFRDGRPPGLRAGISIAGRRPAAPFGGPAVPLLFLHGDRDREVPLTAGREAYDAAPFPKRFVRIVGGRHGEYLHFGDAEYARVSGELRSFLDMSLST